jgi:hypothetical protein
MGKIVRLYNKKIHSCLGLLIISIHEHVVLSVCYSTNRGAPSDGRHPTPGRSTGPRDETLPSIVLMVLMV